MHAAEQKYVATYGRKSDGDAVEFNGINYIVDVNIKRRHNIDELFALDSHKMLINSCC